MAWQKDLGHVESCRSGSSSSSSSTTFAPQSVASIISVHPYPYTNHISSHDIICLFKQHPHCKFNVLITYDKISNGDIPQILTSIFALDAQKKITTLEFSIYFHHPAKIKYGNKNVLSKWLWHNSIYIYIYIHIQSYIHEYMYIYIYTYFCMHTIFMFIFNCIFFKIDNWNHMYIYIYWLIDCLFLEGSCDWFFPKNCYQIHFSLHLHIISYLLYITYIIYIINRTYRTYRYSTSANLLQYSYNIIYTGVMT